MADDVVSRLRESSGRAERQRVIDEACREGEEYTIRNASLEGIDLSGLDLLNVRMEDVDCRGAICRDVRFSHLVNCVFDDVDASRASFPRLERCQFRRAMLTGAYIGGRLRGCDFNGSMLRHAQIGPVLPVHRIDYDDNCFDEADLHGVDAAMGYLPKTSFRGARLTAARLSRCNLAECDLQDTDFTGANITNADFAGAAMRSAVFDGCVLALSQVAGLRAACPAHTDHFSAVSHVIGPRTAALEQVAMATSALRIDWHFHAHDAFPAQKIMITKGASTGELRAHAFQLETRTFIRMYPMGDEPGSLSSILLSIAADYADWIVNPASVKADLRPPAAHVQVGELVHETLAEFFAAP